MLKKCASFIGLLLGAALVVHTLVYLIPGDTASMIAGEYADASDIARIKTELALDRSYWVRYAYYVKNMVRLDMGNSVYSGEPVAGEIAKRIPATFSLALLAMFAASAFGIVFGVIAALFNGQRVDRFLLTVSALFISTPVFVTCFLLTLVFSYWLGILPPSGKEGLNPAYIILPACALASRSIALILRVVRSEMISVLSKQYITMARSLGFSRIKIVCVFALKNVLLPVLTVILLDLGAYLSGAVVVESVFSWPGIGRLMITALSKRDLPVIQGVILFATVVFLVCGALINILQRFLSHESGS